MGRFRVVAVFPAVAAALCGAVASTAAAPVPGVRQAAPAAAKPMVGCSGDSCDGKDPITMGCQADAVAWQAFTGYDGASVTLFRSAACDAAYAEGTGFESNVSDEVTMFYAPQLGGEELPVANVVSSGPTTRSALIGWDNAIKVCYAYDYMFRTPSDSDTDPYTSPAPFKAICSRWT